MAQTERRREWERAHYAANKERILARRRERYDPAEQAEKYQRQKSRYDARVAEYRARHPERVRAMNAVGNAIRRGKLVRPEVCDCCGRRCKPDAHHPNYSRPFEIEWLCRSCHRALHRLPV